MRPQTPPPTRIKRINASHVQATVTADATRLETFMMTRAPITTIAECFIESFPENVLDKDTIHCMMTPTKPNESVDIDVDEEEKRRRATSTSS